MTDGRGGNVAGRHRSRRILGSALLGMVLLGSSGVARAASPTDGIGVSAQTATTTPGFPGELSIDDFVVFVDEDGTLWFKLYPATPWGATPPSGWFSDYVQGTVGEQGGAALALLRCAPEGAATPWEARVHTQGEGGACRRGALGCSRGCAPETSAQKCLLNFLSAAERRLTALPRAAGAPPAPRAPPRRAAEHPHTP